MALDSVPSYPSDLGSSRARTPQQQRVSKEPPHVPRKEERTWTTDTYAPYDDGHQWRKYGEKKLSNSNFPRFYYRCTYKNDMKCPATKQVQQKDTNDPPLFSVTYFNHHTCNSSPKIVGSTPDSTVQSRKAISICFNSHGKTGELPTFLSPSASLLSPSMQPYSSNQQPDMNTYSRQFHWADTSSSTSYAPVKMEADDYAEASASPSTTGALSRTLLPIDSSQIFLLE
ncbi:Os12g0116400 [Oryza sativa Japonica Group]|uniref:Os12g0116400 protein n=1 Tax=Oryza sativa subsp. japonica TaxID=39947 RepID=C7JA35_ORYSJ|nr:Os12g0116400 [Oryza sativa Japonica Group]|eukprot:NP_001176760.1 Os12g0116400 [Oryza sativa Japonica Group]